MRPQAVEGSNHVLTLPGDTTGRGDLPAEVVLTDEGRAFETTWVPSPDERRQIAAGANVLLRLYGTGHPPVSVETTRATVVPYVPAKRPDPPA